MLDDAVVRNVVLLLVAATALAGCGGEVDPARTPAGAAQVRFFEDLYNGRFVRAYAALHPSHQKIVPRDLFVRCAGRTTPVGRLDSIEVLDVFDETVRIPVLGQRRTKAVRVRATSSTGETFTIVNHEVKAGDSWRWVLNAAAVRAYEDGDCPGGG
jgi:hypothetical protein